MHEQDADEQYLSKVLHEAKTPNNTLCTDKEATPQHTEMRKVRPAVSA